MEKTMKLLFPVLCVALLALGAVSCASSGGGGGGDSGAPPLTIDLGTLKVANWDYGTKKFGDLTTGVKNVEPFNKQYSGMVVQFAEPPNVSGYSRVTVRVKYYKEDGEEIKQGDGNAMVVMFIDINGDLEGPEMGAGRNTPLKEFNLGGFSGTASSDRGVRFRNDKNPGGLLIQCANTLVQFIEVTEITFKN